MREIECYDFGTKVIVKVGGVEGIITGIAVRAVHFVYEVEYLANGEYKTVYLNGYEFDAIDGDKKQIGFKTNGAIPSPKS